MFAIVLRTAILYAFVIFAIRIMGKRQVGDLQPSELVITILISEIAAIPIQDPNQPILSGIIAIFVLIIIEVVISILAMKFLKFRKFVYGDSAIVIKDGKLDQKMMKKLRITVSDLVEVLRVQNNFDISQVDYAILETNGNLSVLLKPGNRNATADNLLKIQSSDGLQCLLINDGRIIKDSLKTIGKSREEIETILEDQGYSVKDIFLMTGDKYGHYNIIEKEI